MQRRLRRSTSNALYGGRLSLLLVSMAMIGFPLVSFADSVGSGELDLPTIGGAYSPGGWSTLHRGPANRKWVGEVEIGSAFTSWEVLGGAAVLTAPTMSPDGQTMYVTTGRAKGNANLHAYSLDGRLVWQADPYTSPKEGVDPCAVLSSVIVDVEGDLYIGDCNQLFAYHGDGRLKWVSDLPQPREGDWIVSEELPVNALTTAAFTEEGDVFGVTNFGDVVIFDRRTGRRINSEMRLPGHVPDESSVMPKPKTIFSDGLLDEEIRDWAWQLLVGGAMPSANTPGLSLSSGRLFVAATSTTVGRGALYGLDVSARTTGGPPVRDALVDVKIAFATEMGPGSGSSPSLSPLDHRVYVSDENGRFYSVDADTGEIVWEVQTKAASAAAAVGPNGDIYALQAYGPALIAITEEGEVRWQSDLSELAAAALPESFFLGVPAAIGNGNPTVVDDVVLVPVIYGYETRIFGREIPWPVHSSLVAVDAATGVGRRNVVSLADDSTGITGVLPDGTILNTLGTALTSGAAPLARLAGLILPGDLEALLPTGGLQVSRPVTKESADARAAMASRLAERSDEDRQADASRRPLSVLEFAEVSEGMRVAELMAGTGWYAEVLARAVGAGGSVVAQNNGVSGGRYGEALAERVAASGLDHIDLLDAELDELRLEQARLDAVFLVQFYHDTVWMGVNRAEMNRRIFDSLAPGGVFLVIDHAALAGAGTDEVKSLHRIDPQTVIEEVTAAGFRFDAESSLLSNPADDRTTNVFRPSVRGKTDRFVMRFVKPGNASRK